AIVACVRPGNLAADGEERPLTSPKGKPHTPRARLLALIATLQPKGGSRREGGGCAPLGGRRRPLLAVRGEVARPTPSDDGPSAGHSRSVPPRGAQPPPGSRRPGRVRPTSHL